MATATIKGGDKLDAYLKQLSAKVSKAATLNVGFMAGSTEPDGTSTPMIAAINEYGAPRAKIPPRPFFRNAINKNSEKWGPNLAVLLKRYDFDANAALEVLGDEIIGEVQESITEMFSPALSPITIMLRGMKANDTSLRVTGKTVGEAAARVAAGKTNYGAPTKPLIDTGTMQRNVTKLVK